MSGCCAAGPSVPDKEHWHQGSGSNVIPRRARPGLAGIRPHKALQGPARKVMEVLRVLKARSPHATTHLPSPCSPYDGSARLLRCGAKRYVKSLQSSCTGLYPQKARQRPHRAPLLVQCRPDRCHPHRGCLSRASGSGFQGIRQSRQLQQDSQRRSQ